MSRALQRGDFYAVVDRRKANPGSLSVQVRVQLFVLTTFWFSGPFGSEDPELSRASGACGKERQAEDEWTATVKHVHHQVRIVVAAVLPELTDHGTGVAERLVVVVAGDNPRWSKRLASGPNRENVFRQITASCGTSVGQGVAASYDNPLTRFGTVGPKRCHLKERLAQPRAVGAPAGRSRTYTEPERPRRLR
jgi:hypothetical protein